jgi:DNA-binding NarL/FixJ family response regulator
MTTLTVLLADDKPAVVQALRRILALDFGVVETVADGLALVKAAEKLKPDVIVTDVSMPLLNGIEAVRRIRAINQQTKIVFLSTHPEAVYVTEALQAGGSAYVLKSSAGLELGMAIREVLRGGTFVTPAISAKVTS